MFGASSGRKSDLASDIASLRQDVASLADGLGRVLRERPAEAGESIEALRRAFGNRVSGIGDAGARLAGEARQQVTDAGHRLEARIGESPLPAVMVAAGIGFVLGFLSRGRP